jgi:hypothetical protein
MNQLVFKLRCLGKSDNKRNMEVKIKDGHVKEACAIERQKETALRA